VYMAIMCVSCLHGFSAEKKGETEASRCTCNGGAWLCVSVGCTRICVRILVRVFGRGDSTTLGGFGWTSRRCFTLGEGVLRVSGFMMMVVSVAF